MKKKNKIIIFGIITLTIALFGAFLNLLCFYSNDNKMPVFNSSIDTKNHFGFIDSKEVKFSYLSDIFSIGNLMFSIGDFLILLSLIAGIFNVIFEYSYS